MHYYLCCKNFKSNVVFIEVTKSALEILKVRMVSALVLLVLKLDHEAEYAVAIHATKVGTVRVIILDDAARYLISCIYWA